MSCSEGLEDYVRVVAALRGLTIDEAWVPAVTMHLQRLIDASQIVERSELKSQDLAPRFEP